MRRRRGATAVEFAMLLPLFLFVTWAGFELLWVSYLRTALEQGLQEACDATWHVTVDDEAAQTRAASLAAAMIQDSRQVTCDGTCVVTAEVRDAPTRVICALDVPLPAVLPWSRTGAGLLRSVAPERWTLQAVSVRGAR